MATSEPYTTGSEAAHLAKQPVVDIVGSGAVKAKGGWQAMPFILGNEICERMGIISILLNLIQYLMSNYHMSYVRSAYIVNAVSGTCSLTPLVGAYLADSFLGRYRTIIGCSWFSLAGLVLLAVSGFSKKLRPTQCSPISPELYFECAQASTGQISFLLSAFGLIAIGSGGLRSCNYAFGADQFDASTPEGKRSRQKFFNWFYFCSIGSILIGLTVIVYIQDEISWGLGYLILAILMMVSIFLFLIGSHLYIHIPINGSEYRVFVRVFVAAFSNRNRKLPSDPSEPYEIPSNDKTSRGLTHTATLSFLDKAAIILPADYQGYGAEANRPRRLCTVHQVEECKSIVNLLPIWACGILSATLQGQLTLFTITQAIFTDLAIGHFNVPATSLVTVVMFTALLAAIPIYEMVVIPAARRATKNPRGLSMLTRIGVGIAWLAVTMVVAGLVEWKRLKESRRGVIMSGMWLIPQCAMLGVADMLTVIGQLELYYDQLPPGMRSMAGALLWSNFAIGSYIANLLVWMVQQVTSKGGRSPWLNSVDIDAGRLDKFYYLQGCLSFVNLLLFMACASRYKYVEQDEDKGVGVKV